MPSALRGALFEYEGAVFNHYDKRYGAAKERYYEPWEKRGTQAVFGEREKSTGGKDRKMRQRLYGRLPFFYS